LLERLASAQVPLISCYVADGISIVGLMTQEAVGTLISTFLPIKNVETKEYRKTKKELS
jgi:hypothetical protein